MGGWLGEGELAREKTRKSWRVHREHEPSIIRRGESNPIPSAGFGKTEEGRRCASRDRKAISRGVGESRQDSGESRGGLWTNELKGGGDIYFSEPEFWRRNREPRPSIPSPSPLSSRGRSRAGRGPGNFGPLVSDARVSLLPS